MKNKIGHFHQAISGWCCHEQMSLYSEWAWKLPDEESIVEVGSWLGKSSVYMAVELLKYNKNIKFYAVDHWLGNTEHRDHPDVISGKLYDHFIENIKPVKEKINPIRKSSVEASKEFPNYSLAAVFIDGEHSFEAVAEDILAWLPKIKPGGFLAGDDWLPEEYPGVCDAVTKLLKNVEIKGQIWIYRVPMVGEFTFDTDRGLNLFWERNLEIADTLILAIPDNKNSLKCLARAQESCEKVGQPCRPFWGYDGTDRVSIKTPEHLQNNSAMKMLKVLDDTLSSTEVSCILSHIAAWVYCIEINRPVVILEHDAIMLRPFKKISFSNSIEYLGHVSEIGAALKTDELDEIQKYLDSNAYGKLYHRPQLLNPLLHVINFNYLSILGLHAYAIDPMAAKNLYSQVLKYGIINAADATVIPQETSLVQTGVYAVQALDSEETTTIAWVEDNKKYGRKDTYSIPGLG